MKLTVVEFSALSTYVSGMATRSINQLDTTDTAAEFATLAARLDVALTAERRAQTRLVAAIAEAEAEGERQRRALSR